jgi:hypothetical protein
VGLTAKDLLEEARSRYTEQLKGKDNWDALISVFTAQAQALEDAAFEVLTCVVIADSEGEQLDGIGRILKEPRNGREDADYRTRLTARVGVIVSQGTAEDVLALLVVLTEDIAAVRELFPASFVADVGQTQNPESIAPFVAKARGVAIGGSLHYSRTLAADALTWADEVEKNLFPRNTANGCEDRADLAVASDFWNLGTRGRVGRPREQRQQRVQVAWPDRRAVRRDLPRPMRCRDLRRQRLRQRRQ